MDNINQWIHPANRHAVNEPTQPKNCYEFWKLAETLTFKQSLAVWCNANPYEFNQLEYLPECVREKKQLLLEQLEKNIIN